MKVRLVLPALAVATVLVMLLFPLYWMVISSFTPEGQLFAAPTLVPRALILDHYRALFGGRDFWTPIRNSLIVASATTGLSVGLGAPCAYALARLQFRGKTLTLAFVLAVSMFPQISIVSPLYLRLRELRLINTYPGLVLPYLTFAMPLTIWLLVAFFRQLPADLEEAASMDGAGRLRSLWEIMLPLAWPGLATTAILTFLYSWNEFLFALSFTLGPSGIPCRWRSHCFGSIPGAVGNSRRGGGRDDAGGRHRVRSRSRIVAGLHCGRGKGS